MGGERAIRSVGKKFGRLLVVGVDDSKPGDAVVTASCECGGTWVGKISTLRFGITRSCGCLNLDSIRKRSTTHGMSKTVEYDTWQAIKSRCYNASGDDFHLYQGKGIKVCDRWLESFENFYADMGKRPSDHHSIERKDSNKDYEPSNCYWATPTEQARNTSRNVRLEYRGRSQTLRAWQDELGFDYYGVKSRIYAGWSVAKAFETPVAKSSAGTLIEFDGQALTVSGWARTLGVNVTTLLYRLKSGWPLEKALTSSVQPVERLITINGETMSVKRWCETLGRKVGTVRVRLSAGWETERALLTPTEEMTTLGAE